MLPRFCRGEYYVNAFNWYAEKYVENTKACLLSLLLALGLGLSLLFIALAINYALPISKMSPVVVFSNDTDNSQIQYFRIVENATSWQSVELGLARYIVGHYVSLRESLDPKNMNNLQQFVNDYSSRAIYKEYRGSLQDARTSRILQNLDIDCTASAVVSNVDTSVQASYDTATAVVHMDLIRRCPNKQDSKILSKKVIMSYTLASPKLISAKRAPFHFMVSKYSAILG